MVGPYIITTLTTDVSLKPRQMDNQIYKHLKENLTNKLVGKCYRKYGYIVKIYEITNYTKGRIIPENPQAAALFGCTFTCKLCNPIKNRNIVCKIQKISKLFINATNGPITVIITMDRINNKIFYLDQKTNKLFARLEKTKPIEITPGTYINVTIESKSFNDMDHIIMAMGRLTTLASEEDIKQSFEDEHGTADKVVSFDKYISGENLVDVQLKEQEDKVDKIDASMTPKEKVEVAERIEKEANNEIETKL